MKLRSWACLAPSLSLAHFLLIVLRKRTAKPHPPLPTATFSALVSYIIKVAGIRVLQRPSTDSISPSCTITYKIKDIMGSDDYAVVGGGGALKLKGAKIQKKKKKRSKTDLEKNLETGAVKKDDKKDDDHQGEEDLDETPEVQKTESERRHEEIKKKRVCLIITTLYVYVFANNNESAPQTCRVIWLETGTSQDTQRTS